MSKVSGSALGAALEDDDEAELEDDELEADEDDGFEAAPPFEEELVDVGTLPAAGTPARGGSAAGFDSTDD